MGSSALVHAMSCYLIHEPLKLIAIFFPQGMETGANEDMTLGSFINQLYFFFVGSGESWNVQDFGIVLVLVGVVRGEAVSL